MSTLKARQAVAKLSPITREVFDRIALLHAQDWPFEQKQAVQAQMMALLTPEQRTTVERESLGAAFALQYSNPKQGNRATRRKARARYAR